MFLTIKLCTYAKQLFEMELFLTLKLYLHKTELFNIDIYVCKQNLYLH